MIIIACITLVICVLLLMISQGVGPFANAPWESVYFSFRKLSKPLQALIVYPASLLALLASLIIIGVIQF